MTSQADLRHQRTGALVVVGGGRWARIYLSILARLDPPFAKIIVVSSHGGRSLAEILARAPTITLAQNLDSVLAAELVAAALIVNTARDHVLPALRLLQKGVPVLVEKPVALTPDDSARLIAAARDSGALLMPGHVLRHCEYLRNFAAASPIPVDMQSITIVWRDARDEMRHGEVKTYDAGLGVAEDVGPHIATILSILLDGRCDRIEKARIRRGGLAVEIDGIWNHTAFTLVLERDATSRERLVIIEGPKQTEARLDFSSEPGTMSIGGASRSADPEWPQRASPLTRQLLAFISAAAIGPDPRTLDEIRDSTDFTAWMAQAVRTVQRDWLAASSGTDDAEQLVAIRELIAPLLLEAGCWRPGDPEQLDAFARQALQILQSRPIRPVLADIVREICSDTRA